MKNHKNIKCNFYLLFWAILLISCQQHEESREHKSILLPGAKLYDVTNPASKDGDASLVATPDNPSDDDAPAINAGLQIPAQMQGKSLLPLMNDEPVEWMLELFLESLFTMRDNPFCEGIRQGDWKYIRMYDGINPYREEDIDFTGRNPGYEQLFNLKDDPAETKNLIEQYNDSDLLLEFKKKVSEYSNEMNQQRKEYRQNVAIKEKKSK